MTGDQQAITQARRRQRLENLVVAGMLLVFAACVLGVAGLALWAVLR